MVGGLFDADFCLDKIDQNGDPLTRINSVVDWEIFRPLLDEIRHPKQKSAAGPRGYDNITLFKVIVLQSLYNLSDAAAEAQVLDRLTFKRFLGFNIGDKVPDEKTIWLFREQLKEAGLTKKLFDRFNSFLRENGFEARSGQIIDACIVQSPRQRNTKEENEKIKEGKANEIKGWSDAKLCQKDTDARWKKKNNKNFFGYENHVQADVRHKLIRNYEVTDASVHDSNVFEELIDPDNTSRDVYADSAYRSEEKISHLKEAGYRPQIQEKGYRDKPLTEKQKCGNKRRAKVRARIEHVFGVMAKRMGSTVLRGIGILRAKTRIGLRNLAYNLDRYALLSS